MKPFNQSKDCCSLILVFLFTTVIVLASSAGIPAQESRDTQQEQRLDPLSDELDSPTSTEKTLQSQPAPSAVGFAGTVDEERLAALNGLEPAINPMNVDDVESVNPFFVPVVVLGGGGGGWGRGRYGGGWGGRWGGGGWGGRWGGGGWGGRWGGGGWGGRWGGGWRG